MARTESRGAARRFGRRSFIGAMALAALSGSLLPLSAPGFAALTEEDEAGTVTKLEGKALAIQDAVPRVLGPGAKVYVGDVLSTGADSRLEIRTRDGAVFTLGARTSFNIIDYTFYTGGGAGKSASVFRLIEGAVSGVTGQLALAGGRTEILTDTSTIGIRGTSYWIGPFPDGDLFVAHWSGGGVEVRNDAGAVIIRGDGDGTRVIGRDVAPETPHPWPEWMHRYARWTVAFNPGPQPKVLPMPHHDGDSRGKK